MSHRTRSILLIACLALVCACGGGRSPMAKPTVEGDPRWARLDSLGTQALFRSALQLVDSLHSDARSRGDWRAEVRALLERGRYQRLVGTDAASSILELEEHWRSERRTPMRQVLASVLAEAWWRHYMDHRWEVLERSHGAEDPGSWDQAQYMQRVLALQRDALHPFDSLKLLPADTLGTLLVTPRGEDATAAPWHAEAMRRRPTLYDVLAHRALDILTQDEQRLGEPPQRFLMDDPRHFALWEDFAFLDLRHPDTASFSLQAMRVFQQLTRLRLRDDDPAAFVDMDLRRLAYVHAHSSLPERDSLYLEALRTWRTRCAAHPAWAEVTHAMAAWHAQATGAHDRFDEHGPGKWMKRRAADLCREGMAQFPGSPGAADLAALLGTLELPQLGLRTEEAVLPGQASLALLTYANVGRLWLRIIPTEAIPGRDEPELKDLLLRRPYQAWQVELPDDGDMHTHMVELPLPALSHGHYTLLASDGERFDPEQERIVQASFWCTRLGHAERRLPDGRLQVLVMDRLDGRPLDGVEVELHLGEHNAGGPRFTREASTRTSNEGIALLEQPERSAMSVLVLQHGEDRYQSATGYRVRGWGGREEERQRTHLFTDRAIYRPGQTLQFKGIATVRRGLQVEVRPGISTTVRLFDANGRAVDSLRVSTDSFGAFHGSFRVPGGLTGAMRLSEAHGTAGFQVEEYKRPTFQVALQDPATPAALGGEVHMAGNATAYTGQAIDAAQVRWRVYRTARRPWWHSPGQRSLQPPMGRDVEVASGSSTTDSGGRFALAFRAAPPQGAAHQRSTVYHFRVEVAVTDISGETRNDSRSVVLGERSLGVHIGVPDALDRSTTDSIEVGVKDLNGTAVAHPLQVRIAKLAPPFAATAGPPRKRLWDRPDRHLLDRAAHAERFPMDVYSNEDDPTTWAEAEVVLVQALPGVGARAMRLPGVRGWDVGTYRITATGRDLAGDSIGASQHFTLYDPEVLRSGAEGEAFTVREERTTVEPGGKAVLLIGTALPELRVLMEVERPNVQGSSGTIALQRRFLLKREQQRVEIPVLEDDRGGFTVHLIAAARGRLHQQQVQVNVPWTNKELHLAWETFRDKLLPGQQEEWRLRITGPTGAPAKAQLLVGMYDASLDQFVPHTTRMDLRGKNRPSLGWSATGPFRDKWGRMVSRWKMPPETEYRRFPELDTRGFLETWWVLGATPMQRGDAGAEAVFMMVEDADANALAFTGEEGDTGPEPPVPAVVRGDMRETAYFLPALQTAADGTVSWRFTMPEALTRWKLFALAHTPGLEVGQLDAQVVTSKPMMVVPELPRFLREGDRITLSARVGVLEQLRLEGLATLELFDPASGKDLGAAFGHKGLAQSFAAAPGQRALLEWEVRVPEGHSEVGVRITAQASERPGPMGAHVPAGGHSDGEQHVLPVLPARVAITESLPMAITGAGVHRFDLKKLSGLTPEADLRHLGLTLEFTPSPAWHAIKALPMLMEFPHDCAEQLFGRYYANRMAAHVLQGDEAIAAVLRQWEAVRDGMEADGSAAPRSDLALEETPWVVQVATRREREARLGRLLDREQLAAGERQSLQRLRTLQRADGAWPWFAGMPASRLVTQHIVAGFGQLRNTGAADPRPQGEVMDMLNKALAWMDEEAARTHRERMAQPRGSKSQRPSHAELQYLHARSLHLVRPLPPAARAAVEALRKDLRTQWTACGLQEQAMVALALHRMGERDTPTAILRSLKERAMVSDELGMYWKGFSSGMGWSEFPVETYALLIEAFQEVGDDADAVAALRTHLLTLKRSTDWGNTKATAAAVHALLVGAGEALAPPPMAEITVGDIPVEPDAQEAGTGHFTRTWSGAEVQPTMGKVRVETQGSGQAWAALHWQYLQQADAVQRSDGPLRLAREVLVERRVADQTRWLPLADAPPPGAGDRIRVRLVLETDRWLDHVQLKDMRAAGLEPVDALSGFRFQGQLGCYMSIRDAATHFFVDRVPPGRHVLEHDLRVVHAGDMGAGFATALCMYAPEFAAHSRALRIRAE